MKMKIRYRTCKLIDIIYRPVLKARGKGGGLVNSPLDRISLQLNINNYTACFILKYENNGK